MSALSFSERFKLLLLKKKTHTQKKKQTKTPPQNKQTKPTTPIKPNPNS